MVLQPIQFAVDLTNCSCPRVWAWV